MNTARQLPKAQRNGRSVTERSLGNLNAAWKIVQQRNTMPQRGEQLC